MSVLQPGRAASPPPPATTWRDAFGSVWTDLGNGRWRSHTGEVLTPCQVIASYGPVDPPYRRPHGVQRLTVRITNRIRGPRRRR